MMSGISEKDKHAFFNAAINGDKRRLKKWLDKGVDVDIQNEDGKTALYLACEGGYEGAVELLLRTGACPNRRSKVGATCVHAAAQFGNIKLLCLTLHGGGDLRLHDNKSSSIEDWALKGFDERKRRRMVEFLKKVKLLAVSHQTGVDAGACNSVLALQRWIKERCPCRNVMKQFNSINLRDGIPNVFSFGYESIYMGFKGDNGTIGIIPMVCEETLKHDEYGSTYNNGPFIVMESMKWTNTKVTVKRLHKFPPNGGYVDFLIKEKMYMSRIRHPNILLLMGVCITTDLNGLVLLYERVNYASLFSFLYLKAENLNTCSMCAVIKQICEAVIYLHQMGLLHCCITSHAIQLVNRNYAKLSNFEYMMEKSDVQKNLARCNVVKNRYMHAAYNWMAPEIMAELLPEEKSDLYGICSVLWEVINGMPPWSGMDACDIELELLRNANRVTVPDTIQDPFHSLLDYGLAVDPSCRKMSIAQLRDILHSYLLEEDNKVTPDTVFVKRVPHNFQQPYIGQPSTGHKPPTSTDNCVEHDGNNIPASSSNDEQLYDVTPATSQSLSEKYSILDINQVIDEASSTALESNSEMSRPSVLCKQSSTFLSEQPSQVTVDDEKEDTSQMNITDVESEIQIVVAEINNIAEDNLNEDEPLYNEMPSTENSITKIANKETLLQARQSSASSTDKLAERSSTSVIMEKSSTDGLIEQQVSVSESRLPSASKFSLKKIFSTHSSRRSSGQESAAITSDAPSSRNQTGTGKKKLRKKRNTDKKKNIKESSDDQSQPEYRFIKDNMKRNFFEDKLSRLRISRKKSDEDMDRLKHKNERRSVSNETTTDPIGKSKGYHTLDISGINKLDTDSSQPHSDHNELKKPSTVDLAQEKETDIQPKLSENQSNDVNPFKKFLSSEYDDIISDEIKAILAKPMKMPKLPSQYKLNTYSRKSIENKPPSMAETLIRLYPSPGKPARLISPVRHVEYDQSTGSLPAGITTEIGFCSSSPLNYQTLPQPKSFKTITSPLGQQNRSYSSFGSSVLCDSFDNVVKPASHHIPEKSPVHADHIEHYAFPKSPRTVTYPGCVSAGFQPVRLNEGKSSHVFGLENSGVVPPVQTKEIISPRSHAINRNDSTSQRVAVDVRHKQVVHHTSSFNECRPKDHENDAYDMRRDQAYFKQSTSLRDETNSKPEVNLSPRDKFLGMNDYHRSETFLPAKNHVYIPLTNSNTMSSRTIEIDTKEKKPSPLSLRDSLCNYRFTNARVTHEHNSSVRNIAEAFQKKLEKHIEKQASLIARRTSPIKVTKPSYSSDTFFTPQHLRYQTIPPSRKQMPTPLVYQALEGDKSRIATANIILQKPGLKSSSNIKEMSKREPKKIALSPICDCSNSFSEPLNCSLKEPETVTSPTSTDEDVGNFVNDLLTTCHQEVLQKYVHPGCPHKSPGQKLNTVDTAPVVTPSEVNASTTDTLTVSSQKQLLQNQNNGNSAMIDISAASGGSCDSATVNASHHRSRASDESSFGRKPDGDIEDIYFDDVINPDLYRERHMRLQNTIGLDQDSEMTPSSLSSMLDPTGKPLFSTKKESTEDNHIQECIPVYDIETPKFPKNAISSSSFKNTRKLSNFTKEELNGEDDDDDICNGSNNSGYSVDV